MNMDDFLNQYQAACQAEADAICTKIQAKYRRKVLEKHAELLLAPNAEQLARCAKTPVERYIQEFGHLLEPDDLKLLEVDEVGTQDALDYLGEPWTAKKLARLLDEGILKPGGSHIPGHTNKYCTMSIVDLLIYGLEALRKNAKGETAPERNLDDHG